MYLKYPFGIVVSAMCVMLLLGFNFFPKYPIEVTITSEVILFVTFMLSFAFSFARKEH